MMHKMFNIKDVSGKCGQAVRHAGDFLPYAQQKLGFNKPVGVNFVSDMENAKDPFGKTAYYDPNKMEITVYVDKRHVKDILRSLSHELVHHTQNCRGEFDREHETGPGYAQRDPHMRKMEAEAYLLGNGFLFRDYEDQLKQENQKMSEISENKMPMKTDTEDIDGDGRTDDKVPAFLEKGDVKPRKKTGNQPPQLAQAQEKAKKAKKTKKEGIEEDLDENLEENLDEDAEVNENWTKGSKDQLLFETLMKKWTK